MKEEDDDDTWERASSEISLLSVEDVAGAISDDVEVLGSFPSGVVSSESFRFFVAGCKPV